MKKCVLFIILFLLFVGCGANNSSEVHTENITVVTSNFALYDFVRVIGGEKVSVSMLLSPGVEAHSYEPTPRDIVSINKCALFVCVSRDAEPWVETILEGSTLDTFRVVETGNGLLKHASDHGVHEEDLEDDHDVHIDEEHAECEEHGTYDPHVWLDPVLAKEMVKKITASLITVDSLEQQWYQSRSDSLIVELQALHLRFEETFDKIDNPEILYAGHFAFGYFADRYGIEHHSPYTGFSPNAEPSPRKVAELIKLVEDEGFSTIYYEELVEPRVAEVIVRESGAEMKLLHGIHNVSSEELVTSFSYLEGMEQNRLRLEEGLTNE